MAAASAQPLRRLAIALRPQRICVCITRRKAASTSSPDSRQSFSLVWQSVDGNRHDGAFVTPDPIAYLRGFDKSSSVEPYRQALLEACSLKVGQRVLDVGCGLGRQTAAISEQVGASGDVLGVDASHDAVVEARRRIEEQKLENARILHGNAYQLELPSHSFDVIVEDRMLQHLERPFEALKEMIRVSRPGATIVCGNPDWRSFQIDVTGAGYTAEGDEQGRRWGEARRPPQHLAVDFGNLTMRILNGVIPRLTAHSYLGIAQRRLMQAAGLEDVQCAVVPVKLHGREALETIVPITYFSRLSQNNGGVTAAEANLWLDRLAWEGDDELFGTLTFYVCSGRVPQGQAPAARVRLLGTEDVHLAAEVTALINASYMESDTGITLSTKRIPETEVVYMIQKGEMIAAFDEVGGDMVGCIQVLVKDNVEKQVADPGANAGLPKIGDGPIGEFTCLAVLPQSAGKGAQRRGLGSALVRAAEAHCRSRGCRRMLIAVICPNVTPQDEPPYKQWLQQWYLRLGYDHHSTLHLRFKPPREGSKFNEEDELHEMYSCLRQLVPCKGILMHKVL